MTLRKTRIGLGLVGLLVATATAAPGQPLRAEPASQAPRLETIYYDYTDDTGQLSGGRATLLVAPRGALDMIPAEVTPLPGRAGPPANRIDLVTVGDGYTASQLGLYASHVNAALSSIFDQEPFQTYAPFFNIYIVDVLSNESGVDHDPTYPLWRDTALDMGFWCDGIERLLCVNVAKAYAYANNAPDVDLVLAVANSTKYGGAGYPDSDLATVSGGNGGAAEITLHEIGHGLGDLADEYEYGGGPTYEGPEPLERNVSILDHDAMAAAGTKWATWLDEYFPDFDGLVSTYEGAYYCEYGIYRPTINSKMRNLGRPFNMPSAEALVISFYKTVRPIDDATPTGQVLNSDDLVFVDPVDPADHALDIQWELDGWPIPGATAPTLDFSTVTLAPGVHTLAAVVVDNTGWVRDEDARTAWLTETRTWVVQGGPAPLETDVLHYLLDLEIDPAGHWIGGSNTMTVRSLEDGLNVFRIRLHDVLTITDLRVAGTPASWTRLDGANIEVTLDRPYAHDEVFELYIAYDGHPQSEGSFGSITFRTRNGHPEVFTESDPWYAYTWWPAKDDLSDKTTADLWFTVPSTLKVASNGVLQGMDDIGADKLRYRWKTEVPTEDYLYCFATTNYDTFDATWDYDGHSMPLQFFIYPEHNTSSNRSAWLACGPMLSTFSDLFGVYPFVSEKYGMCEWGGSGAMEHQTMTSMYGFNESTIAHELAHQWWGDAVTYATWHDIWLSEGFATYSEALWREFRPGSPGEPALHAYMANMRPGEPSGSVYVYDPDSIELIFNYQTTYLKAGWVLHMLRHVVGTDAFFDILAAYRAAYEHSTATTEDFEQVAEAVAGRDLAWFFDEWIYGVGAPRYIYAYQPIVADGAPYLELFIAQMQGTLESVFTMPIDITTTDIEGHHQTYVVWNDARMEYLLFPVPGANIESAAFDPTPWILRSSAGEVVFEGGPPKIVKMNPAPGAAVALPDVSTLEVVFHKDVVASGTDFALVGQRSGPIACAFSYDADRHAATLTPAAPLGTDTYTLTVSDQIVDTAAGLALDGELVKPDGPEPLPSGDGVPGGSAVAQFAVVLRGDVNCDGTVNLADINPFVLLLSTEPAWRAMYPGCPILNGDINGDGTAGQGSFGDINPFVALLSGG